MLETNIDKSSSYGRNCATKKRTNEIYLGPNFM